MKSVIFSICILWLLGCSGRSQTVPIKQAFLKADTAISLVAPEDKRFKGREVPVLCYHQVRDWKATDSRSARTYIMPSTRFQAQLRMLHDSGYHTISPDQLADYLLHDSTLPEKPVLLTFDDGTTSQYTGALPELERYSFKAAFFIMTVTLDRPGYLGRKQVRELNMLGHTIGCHSWDHHDVRHYTGQDWELQLQKPTKLLEDITGKRMRHFAYPFGAWNSEAVVQLKKHRYVSAFQLSGPKDPAEPIYTIRRIIVDGHWTADQLNRAMKNSFNQ